MNKNPHEFQRPGRYEFTPEEIAEMRTETTAMVNNIATLTAEEEGYKAQAKECKTRADALRLESATRAKKVVDGYEMRPYPCLRFKSYKHGEWIFVQVHTLEILACEDFQSGDSQRGIGELVWPADEGGNLVDFMQAWWTQEEADAARRNLASDIGGVTSVTISTAGRSVTMTSKNFGKTADDAAANPF